MMTHVVFLYMLMVVYPNGNVHTHTYNSFEACDQVKQQFLILKQQTGTPLKVKCVPEQFSRPVDDHDSPNHKERKVHE